MSARRHLQPLSSDVPQLPRGEHRGAIGVTIANEGATAIEDARPVGRGIDPASLGSVYFPIEVVP